MEALAGVANAVWRRRVETDLASVGLSDLRNLVTETAACEAALRSIDQATQSRHTIRRRVGIGVSVATLMAGFPLLDLAELWTALVWLLSGAGGLVEFRRQAVARQHAEEFEFVLAIVEDWRRDLENEIAWRSGRLKIRPERAWGHGAPDIQNHPVYQRIIKKK